MIIKDDDNSFLDEILDAASEEVIIPVLPKAPKGRGVPIDVPGFVPCPNKGSFYAKAVLKRLGGHFNWDNKTWYVPVARREEAFAACKEGAQRNAELVVEEVAHLLAEDANAVAEARTCWECGGSLYEYPRNAAGQTWSNTAPRLKVGAIVDEAYCGCVERGDSKRRHRPDFRNKTW